MKKTWLIIFALLLFFPVLVLAESLTFEWDPNDPAPEGYRLFKKLADEEYTEHAWEGQEATATIEIEGVEGQKTTYYFIVRAFAGEAESENSNEVNYTVDLVSPPPVSDFVVEYDMATNEIELRWTQSEVEPVEYWKVFISEVKGGPYTEFDIVENTGPASAVSSQSLVIPAGESKTFYFVIVSFKNDDLYSANSIEVEKTIDKRSLSPVNTLRIKVE